MKNKNAGFSLIELIVVIAILVIVSGIGINWIVNISGYRARECSSKISSSLSSTKVKAMSKEKVDGDVYWKLYKNPSGNGYMIDVATPIYDSSLGVSENTINFNVETSKAGKPANVKVEYVDSTGTHEVTDADPLILSYKRNTGALLIGREVSGKLNFAESSITAINVTGGKKTYTINIVAKTGKITGRN